MVGRAKFIAELHETLHVLCADIEERETIDPDLAIIRELAEQMMEEVESLSEDL